MSTTTTLDTNAHYTVDGFRGIAFYALGWDYEKDWETGEHVDSDSWVRVVMVGDDTVHIVEIDDLTKIPEEAYCHECGQIGCKADGRDA